MAKRKISGLRTVATKLQSRGYKISVAPDSIGTRRVFAVKKIGSRSVTIKFGASAKRGRGGARSGLGVQTTTPGGSFRGRFISNAGKIRRRDRRGRFSR